MTEPDSGAAKPLIIFDVDGTLIGGESYDWSAFEAAFLEVTGAPFSPEFFDQITEVTASSIIRTALPELDDTALQQTIDRVSAGYRERLAVDIDAHPEAFPATPGAIDLLPQLQSRGFKCAIATGDWFESISLKLNAAGIPWRGLPMATSSDRPIRSQIISLAAERALRPITNAIYVGDGTWDLRATQSLDIPFIGCGKNIDQLKAAGAQFVVPNLKPDRFFAILNQLSQT